MKTNISQNFSHMNWELTVVSMENQSFVCKLCLDFFPFSSSIWNIIVLLYNGMYIMWNSSFFSLVSGRRKTALINIWSNILMNYSKWLLNKICCQLKELELLTLHVLITILKNLSRVSSLEDQKLGLLKRVIY